MCCGRWRKKHILIPTAQRWRVLLKFATLGPRFYPSIMTPCDGDHFGFITRYPVLSLPAYAVMGKRSDCSFDYISDDRNFDSVDINI